MSNTDEPWINTPDWEAAVARFGLAVIADCRCGTPGPVHTSVTDMGGAVIAVCLCMNCGGIMSTGAADD